MKRILLSLMASMVALMMAAPVALAAAPIYCTIYACHGTSYSDVMYGPDTGSAMHGYGGNDFIYGYGGNDFIYGYGGNDWIFGGTGNDHVAGMDGDDYLYGDDGADRYIGGYGNDKMYDRRYSDDTYLGLWGGGNDVIVDSGGVFDTLDLSQLTRSQVLITWRDTSDSDTNLDALHVEQKGATNVTVLVRNYFDNSGGLGRGDGDMRSIRFKDKTLGFPASEG
jgi:Ca2+-binding RTX toxin-like protein